MPDKISADLLSRVARQSSWGSIRLETIDTQTDASAGRSHPYEFHNTFLEKSGPRLASPSHEFISIFAHYDP